MTREEAMNVLKANYPDPCFSDLRKAVDMAIKALEQPEQRWIPCSVVNECYIPELKDVDYKGILFTYETATGKKLVKVNWIERGRIIGKQMNGTPIAYMPLPEPYREEGEK